MDDGLPDSGDPDVGGLMAVLAVIGGIDGRLRLGGQVTHDEFGEGTVTRITPKGRITVQFADMRTCRVCPLSQLKPVGGLGPVRGRAARGLRWDGPQRQCWSDAPQAAPASRALASLSTAVPVPRVPVVPLQKT